MKDVTHPSFDPCDARCALCTGCVGEEGKPFKSAKTLRPASDLRLPSGFEEEERVALRCRHVAHAMCVLVSMRRQRLEFLRRYLRTLDYFPVSLSGGKPLDSDARQRSLSNAWYVGSLPYITCRLCSTEWDCDQPHCCICVVSMLLRGKRF